MRARTDVRRTMQIITSLAQAASRGQFALFKRSAPSAQPAGTQRAVMVCQLPWGPTDTQTPFVDAATFRATFAPDGFDRTGAAYLMATLFPYPDLEIIRIKGSGAAKATCEIQDSAPANSLLFTAKWYGAAPNTSMSIVIAAADDAVTAHFNLTITMTNPTTGRQSQEVYKNVDSAQVPDDSTHTYWATLIKASNLVGTLVRQAGGRPVNGTYTFSTGSDGTYGSAQYLGTPGNGDAGLAVAEKDSDVRFVFTDDPGSGNIAAVNAGLKAHELLMQNRVAILQALPGDTDATAKTDAALNVDDACCFSFPHATVNDDEGVSRTIPTTGPLVAMFTNNQPHVSPAIKKKELTQILSRITGLDFGTGSKQVKDQLAAAGVIVWEKNSNGVFSPYNSEATSGTPSYVTRMRQFLATSLAVALEDYQNSPNSEQTQDTQDDIVKNFLDTLVANGKKDDIALPGVVDAQVLPRETLNTINSIQNGDYFIAVGVELFAEQKRLFLVMAVDTSANVITQVVQAA